MCDPSISHLYIYLVDESLTKRGRGRPGKTIRETIVTPRYPKLNNNNK